MSKHLIALLVALAVVAGLSAYLLNLAPAKKVLNCIQDEDDVRVVSAGRTWRATIVPDKHLRGSIEELGTRNFFNKTARMTLHGIQIVEGCPSVEVYVGGLSMADGYVGSYTFYPVTDKTPHSAYFDITNQLLARINLGFEANDIIEIRAVVSGKNAKTRIESVTLEIVE